MDQQALTYVLEKARIDDVNITQEQGRQSLGALGLSGEMALARIGTPIYWPRQCTCAGGICGMTSPSAAVKLTGLLARAVSSRQLITYQHTKVDRMGCKCYGAKRNSAF